MPEDRLHFFICFSSKDQAIAFEIVQFLEADGLKCWISSRDILPGHNYQESIVTALETATGIVFLFSEASNTSAEIRKELSLADSGNRPVFPLRLSPVTPAGALRYELATRQWIDIFPDREKALRKLAQTLRPLAASPSALAGHRDATEGAAALSGAAPRVASFGAPLPAPAMRPQDTPHAAATGTDFEAIRALLARHIGPIAKIYVQKAAAEARTTEEFCERLAAHLGASADRAAFLKAVRTHLTRTMPS